MSFKKKEPSSKDSDISKFNYNLSILLNQMAKVYPDDYDLTVWEDKFEWSKSVNVYLACEQFMEVAQSYIKEIMTEKEEEFIHNDYDNISEDYKQYVYLIHKCIELWQTSENEKLKKNIWKIAQTLLTYGIKAKKRHDLLPVINQYRKTPLVL